MKAAMLLPCALAALTSPDVYEVVPSDLPWARLRETFDLAARLPVTRRAKGPDLVERMQALLALRFELRAEGDGPVLTTFGDLAAAARDIPDDARGAWLRALESVAPAELATHFEHVRTLLLDAGLRSTRWLPDRDLDDDGLLIVDAWELAAEGAPWKDLPGEPTVEQGAVLVHTSVATFKAVENDYPSYARHAGPGYEKLRPIEGTYFRGTDPRGNAFASLRLDVRRDLPFPFGDYGMKLCILNHVDDAGRLVTDVYSKSRDFHWLAGRDVFLPVSTSTGAAVGTLVVRLYGFDLDGVPDAPKHRRAALRGSLGNLKRAAEAVARERGGARDSAGLALVPEFRVLGAR